ncbi:nucleotidyltransferase family protein [Flavobacterium sp.]|uniref:nucleotidyltransferase family protein n=1 Tax=Flavobacterium sp. TaxID=239 RepID=UPI0037500A28
MISKSQQDIIIKVLKPYQPKRIGLFGSVARNQETSSSDIDILFSLKNPIGLFTLSDIHFELEEKLNKKVDLVSENGLNKFLKDKILKEVKYIYEVL